MLWIPSVLLRIHSFLFSILFSGILETGEVRTPDSLGSEFPGTRFRECYINKVSWDMIKLTFMDRADQYPG